MTLCRIYHALACSMAVMLVVMSGRVAQAQTQLSHAVRVDAVIGSFVKVQFDRMSVVFDTQAYDPATVLPVQATPLTVTTKARVPDHTRVVLTVQADGPFVSGASTIPANKLSWTATGPGFDAGGTANEHAARTLGSWRGSGIWTGTQVYTFDDSWSYTVGVYTMTMTYTVSAP